MRYKTIGDTATEISVVSLGGHEYLPDKRSRGFNEDFKNAVKPGYIFEGFGQENRKLILRTAFEQGINFLDVTMDSEKEALGRNLKEVPPPFPVYIQTRPEGFVYTYDENNVKMADYDLLKAEAVRILRLLKRERIEFFNLAFMKEAMTHDPEYLGKIARNVEGLKKEGLIQFACADTFSGEETYLAQIEVGCFDVVYVNFNFADSGPSRNVLPRAKNTGLGVVAREAFMKGALFKMAKEAGLEVKASVSRAALRWCLAHEEVTSVVYGTGNVEHLLEAVEVAERPVPTEEDVALIERIRSTDLFKAYEAEKRTAFFGPASGSS